MRKQKGITLISLVITVIVLVILSAVSIYLTLGNNGILNKAEYAKNETTKQTATEKMNLKITTAQINTYTEFQRMPTLEELAITLDADSEIEYVNGSKTVASLADIDFTTAESIFTKLVEFPYEFEINSSLQLASIDGVKVDSTSNIETAKMMSLTNKDDNVYDKTQGGYIFQIGTSITNYSPNVCITLRESIENYDVLLFQTALGNSGNYRYTNTIQLVTAGIIEMNNSESRPIYLVNSYGDVWGRVHMYFDKDEEGNTQIIIYSGQASASWEHTFKIIDIYGIKY